MGFAKIPVMGLENKRDLEYTIGIILRFDTYSRNLLLSAVGVHSFT